MVCLERIADELHFRPPERFLWATHDCQGGDLGRKSSPSSAGGGIHGGQAPAVVVWPERPVFQLFSQDVVELVVYAEGQLRHEDTTTMSSSEEAKESRGGGGGSPSVRKGNKNSRSLLTTGVARAAQGEGSSSGGALSANALLQALSLTVRGGIFA